MNITPLTQANFQWGAVANPPGFSQNPAAVLPVGLAMPPLVDNDGRQWVVPFGSVPPAPPFSIRVQAASAPLLVETSQITVAPTLLENVFGFNDRGALAYVQIHDTVGPIFGGAVPVISMPVPSKSQFSIAVQWELLVGFGIAISTTPTTFTTAALTGLWWNAIFAV